MSRALRLSFALVALCAAFGLATAASAATATSTSDLQAQTDAATQQINELQNEIQQLQIQLNNTSTQKQTLQSAVQALDLNIQKLTKSITLTNAQIAQKDKQIAGLSNGISTTTTTIGATQEQVASSLRDLAEHDVEPIAEVLLAGGTLSDFFNEAVTLGSLRDTLENKIEDLSNLKTTLQTNKTSAQQSRAQLAALQTQLNQQKQSLAIARQSQNDLLTQTKNQESSYQALISQKQGQESSLEQALTDLKSQYNVAANPNDYPPPTPSLFAWPFSASVMASCATKTKAVGNSKCITQYFGNTPFAQAHASLYSGNGHDGVDIAVPIGTPVQAALSGVILGTGNTDAIKGCYSFGKWVMIKHDNGLNTMYAHLSQISVTPGQSVTTGQLIGYSGETGYATGPHLHFGVYVSAVTVIIPLGQATKTALTPCHLAVMPVPPVSGYLNPLNYLPPVN
jgi:murein DD-endopeptidase MepM/ murein hydrolase activator NlpD